MGAEVVGRWRKAMMGVLFWAAADFAFLQVFGLDMPGANSGSAYRLLRASGGDDRDCHRSGQPELFADRKPEPAAFRFGFGHGVQCTADVSCWATRLLLADTNDHTLSGTLPKNTGLPKNQVLDGQNVLANLATGRRSAINILCGNDCLFSFA